MSERRRGGSGRASILSNVLGTLGLTKERPPELEPKIEARLMAQEHRPLAVLLNYRDHRNSGPNDPRTAAVKRAFGWLIVRVLILGGGALGISASAVFGWLQWVEMRAQSTELRRQNVIVSHGESWELSYRLLNPNLQRPKSTINDAQHAMELGLPLRGLRLRGGSFDATREPFKFRLWSRDAVYAFASIPIIPIEAESERVHLHGPVYSTLSHLNVRIEPRSHDVPVYLTGNLIWLCRLSTVASRVSFESGEIRKTLISLEGAGGQELRLSKCQLSDVALLAQGASTSVHNCVAGSLVAIGRVKHLSLTNSIIEQLILDDVPETLDVTACHIEQLTILAAVPDAVVSRLQQANWSGGSLARVVILTPHKAGHRYRRVKSEEALKLLQRFSRTRPGAGDDKGPW